MEPSIVKLPTHEGWWARRVGGCTRWHFVAALDNEGLGIWSSDIEDFIPVFRFFTPLGRWFGPIQLPVDWED